LAEAGGGPGGQARSGPARSMSTILAGGRIFEVARVGIVVAELLRRQ
jgi:hypothetical protein